MESIVTLWFVTAADPARVIEAEPRADRGFGRKYLAQFNPAWPITLIGQFPLNRSVQASTGEFYIAGFPGVAIVQTVLEDTPCLSEINPRLLTSVPAAEVFAFAVNEETGYGGLAHWRGGVLKRSLCTERLRIYEDIGLPVPFESPYWAGERAEPIGGIALPFEPIDLVREAQRSWLGVDISPEGPDIHVVAYAVDGRPEPKIDKAPARSEHSPTEGTTGSTELALDGEHGYDDYENHSPTDPEAGEFARVADAASAAAHRIGKKLRRRISDTRAYLAERLRHSDRD
ncbi:DUF6928 family protein [Corynebacterium alimapuense]|uniref:Uncharacterized protein n=1 Tax=Corynebacterium alimapuense TaxID=1576874 RepID=A0A3M8K7V6_9CORY|nr:hypothetical protein [Corynebacterium alimapuense]RNE48642.1 hypothetical protein C5L39_09180 [Corynebacterium alimapuense]